jgi:hypothetical protein
MCNTKIWCTGTHLHARCCHAMPVLLPWWVPDVDCYSDVMLPTSWHRQQQPYYCPKTVCYLFTDLQQYTLNTWCYPMTLD